MLKVIFKRNLVKMYKLLNILKFFQDPCNPNPCISGTCSNEGGNFLCHCSSGYSGTRCENRDNCKPNPCNLGKCISQIDRYFCECPPGYSGKRCENKNFCEPNPCQNGVCLQANNQSI